MSDSVHAFLSCLGEIYVKFLAYKSVSWRYVLNFIFLQCPRAETPPPPPLRLQKRLLHVTKPLEHNTVHKLPSVSDYLNKDVNIKGTHTVYFSSSLYIINQKPMIHRTHFNCITTWVARSSG